MSLNKRARPSDETRKHIVNAHLTGIKQSELVNIFNLPKSTISSIIKTYKTQHRTVQKKRGKQPPKKITPEIKSFLFNLIETDCTITLQSMKERIKRKYDIDISNSTISRFLKQEKITLKRVKCISAEQNTMETIEMRKEYAKEMLDIIREGRKEIIYVDEAGINLTSRTMRGWSKQGTEAIVEVQGKNKRISICCGINEKGIVYFETRKQTFDGIGFGMFLERLIAKREREDETKEFVIVMDNASIHHVDLITNIINETKHEIIYLPPYSPFLNPIEQVFSQWKHHVSKMRTNDEETMLRTIDATSKFITQENCTHYFEHVFGYLERCSNGEMIN